MQQYRPTGFKILPPVVKNILIINGLFFLATFSLHNAFKIDLTDILGMHYFGSELFRPFQIVTYMFMHDPAGIGHIFFNMFALWMFGNVLESYWGPKRFLIYYMVTGIGAILIQMLVNYFQIQASLTAIDAFQAIPDQSHFDSALTVLKGYFTEQNFLDFQSGRITATDLLNTGLQNQIDTPTIGASGAVFGILLAFGMMFPNSLIYLYFAIPIKAKWFVLGYGALELYLGFSNSSDNVAHFAHLGGMLFGFLLIIYWNKKIKNRFF